MPLCADHVRAGASVLYVTGSGLLCAVRTRVVPMYAVRVPASGVPYVPCNRDGLGLLWGGDNQRTVARQVSFDLRCVPLSLFVHDWKVRSKQ